MSRTVLTSEPTSARAGDTWEWTKNLPDYPAGTWTLTYTFFNASATFSIVASADGTTHSIDVAPATTSAYSAGRYDWIAHVSDGTNQYQVGRSAMQVMPDLSSASSYDARSHARKMLDAINAELEGTATAGLSAMVKSDIAGRTMEYSVETLLKLRSYYVAAVRAEDDAQSLANGQDTGRFFQVRFTG